MNNSYKVLSKRTFSNMIDKSDKELQNESPADRDCFENHDKKTKSKKIFTKSKRV